jgi:hypothetical protein
MGFKSVMKKIAQGAQKALPVASVFFPQLQIVERLSHINQMTGAEKEDLAIQLFQSQLLDHLLPEQLESLREDPVFTEKTSQLVKDTIALENYVKDKFKK